MPLGMSDEKIEAFSRAQDIDKATRNLRIELAAVKELLEYILDNGSCYITAIEGGPNADFEEWEQAARIVLQRPKSGDPA